MERPVEVCSGTLCMWGPEFVAHFWKSEGCASLADIIGSVSISLCLLALGYNGMGQVIMSYSLQSFILGCKQVRHSGKEKYPWLSCEHPHWDMIMICKQWCQASRYFWIIVESCCTIKRKLNIKKKQKKTSLFNCKSPVSCLFTLGELTLTEETSGQDVGYSPEKKVRFNSNSLIKDLCRPRDCPGLQP